MARTGAVTICANDCAALISERIMRLQTHMILALGSGDTPAKRGLCAS
jgi:hypothetical protein